MTKIEPKQIMPENCYFNPKVVKCPLNGSAHYTLPCEGCLYNPNANFDREGIWRGNSGGC